MPELLSGQLGPIGLSSVLQLASTEGVSGRLTLSAGCEIDLHEGSIVEVRCKNARGLDGLRMAFVIPDGRFALTDEAPPPGKSLGNTAALILDGLRFADEWQEHAPRVLARDAASGWRPRHPAAAAVLALLDGELTLAEALTIAGEPPPSVLDDVRDALRAGAAYDAAPPAPERAKLAQEAPDDELFFNQMDEGRKLLRAGDLARAELAFRRALRARPEDRMARQNLRRVLEMRKTAPPPSRETSP